MWYACNRVFFPAGIYYYFFLHWADTQENANQIARAVTVEYESLGPPLVDLEDAIRANSYVPNVEPMVVKVGDTKSESVAMYCSSYMSLSLW